MRMKNFKSSQFLAVVCVVLISLVFLSKPAAANAGAKKPGDVTVEKDLVTEIPANILNTRMLKLDVKSYAGHTIVPGKDPKGDYNTHLFYWFFESRNSQYVPEECLNVPEFVTWVTADDEGPVTEALAVDAMADAAYLLPALFKNYRVLMYTGNFDLICGFNGTEYILWNLDRFSPGDMKAWVNGWLKGWRQLHREVWVLPPNQTLGYIKHYDNVTQVNIPLAGHLVPIAQPQVSRSMINNWIFKLPFPAYDPLEKKLKCCDYVELKDCIK